MTFTRKYINLDKDIREGKRTSYTIPIEWFNEIKFLIGFYSRELEENELRCIIEKKEDKAIVRLERKLFSKFDLKVFSKECEKGRRVFYFAPSERNTLDKICESKEVEKIIGDNSINLIYDEDEIILLLVNYKGLEGLIR